MCALRGEEPGGKVSVRGAGRNAGQSSLGRSEAPPCLLKEWLRLQYRTI